MVEEIVFFLNLRAKPSRVDIAFSRVHIRGRREVRTQCDPLNVANQKSPSLKYLKFV